MLNQPHPNTNDLIATGLRMLTDDVTLFDAQATLKFIQAWVKLGNSWEDLNIPIVDERQRIVGNIQQRIMQAIISNAPSFNHDQIVSFMQTWASIGKTWDDLNIPLTDIHQHVVGNLQSLLMQAMICNIPHFTRENTINFIWAWVKLKRTWDELDVSIVDEHQRIIGNFQRHLLNAIAVHLPSMNAHETASLFWGLAKLDRSWDDFAMPLLDSQHKIRGSFQALLINALIRNLLSFTTNDLTVFLWAWGNLGKNWEALNIPVMDGDQRIVGNLQQYLLKMILINLPLFNAHETINFLRFWSNMGNTWATLNIPITNSQQRTVDTFQNRVMRALIRNLGEFDLENTIDFLMVWHQVGRTWNDLHIPLRNTQHRVIGNVQNALATILQKAEGTEQFERYLSVLFNKMAIKATMDVDGKYRAENQKLMSALEQSHSPSEAVLLLYAFCSNGLVLNQYSISKIINLLGERFGLYQLSQHFYQTALNHHCANDYVRSAFMELCLYRGDNQMAIMTYRQAQQDQIHSPYMDKLYKHCQFSMMEYATHRQHTLFGHQTIPAASIVSDAERPTPTPQHPLMRSM
ncbi:hypothetical protein [Legionella nagasakiensis]|uniref:hypothetical protein n=1 Tax=Legionella nagasakiensis TaxID=535290 RepID=UPI0010559C21|nr:hypothetical protein [Legionella nagasakiensis]